VLDAKINFCERTLLMQTMQWMVTTTKSTTSRLPPVGTSYHTEEIPTKSWTQDEKVHYYTSHTLAEETVKKESKLSCE